MTWLLDTGPLVAFFDRDDQHHEWAKKMWSRATVPLKTCEPVLAEASYLLQTHAGVAPDRIIALIQRKVIISSFVLQDHAVAVSRILERYHDRGIQLADACLVHMSELNKDSEVFTIDKTDFRIYRRFERQVIPLIAPD
jgi:predicted nucleic acid-binding protein